MMRKLIAFATAMIMLVLCFAFTATAQDPETFEIVSATLNPETFEVTFEFSEEVRIMNSWQIAFSTRPAPSGEIKDNGVVIGYDQCDYKSITYVDPTVFEDKQYSKTVIVAFKAQENFIFKKGDPAKLTECGVRFMEYTDSTDHGNGYVSPKIIKSINGKVLKANYAQGAVDINWIPTEDWYDAMADRNISHSGSFDVTMDIGLISPEISCINTIDAQQGKLEFAFTSKVKLNDGYNVSVDGIDSVSVASVTGSEYDVSYIVDFGTDVSGATEFSIPEEMFTTLYGAKLGETKEGNIADFPLPSFGDDISEKFEIGEEYSFMNTDTGRMLTVDGKTEFKLEYYESANKYALVDGDGKFVNLQTLGVQDDRYIFDIVLNNDYERFQLIAKNGTVLYDDDKGDTNAASVSFAEYGTNNIETGWYMTKSGDELPKKFAAFGDSITCGVIPTADNNNSTVKPGYRKELSAKLLKEYGRVVFVGSLKHARGSNTTAIDNTLVTDGFLYRHEGHSGWTIESGHYPNAASDHQHGLSELREMLQTKYAPDVIFMMIGINDLGLENGGAGYGGNETAINTIVGRWETLVRNILEDLPDDGILFGASLTPRTSSSTGDWHETWNSSIEKVNAKYQAVIDEINAEGDTRLVKADNYTYVKNAGSGALSSDTIHLSISGHTALANSYYDAYTELAPAEKPACDFDKSGEVDADDAIYLLYNVFFGDEEYPLTGDGDVNADGEKNADDAIYLLYNVFFGGTEYPLYP